MKNFRISGLAFLAIIGMASCSKDDAPVPVNEEEVITTVITTLSNTSGSVVLTSKDLDGDGPNAPVLTQTGTIVANRVYVGSVKFLNEQKTPAEDITPEVVSEGKDHQVFFQPEAGVGTFTYADTDVNGRPIGVMFNFTAGAANAMQKNLIVTLRHEPVKTASGVATGNIANAGGDTDIEVTYRVVITP